MGRHLAQPLSFESHTDNTALCLPVTNVFYYAFISNPEVAKSSHL